MTMRNPYCQFVWWKISKISDSEKKPLTCNHETRVATNHNQVIIDSVYVTPFLKKKPPEIIP